MHRDAHLDARTVFLSDLRLGTRDCEAERLLAFLEHARMDRLVLLGEVVDLWSLKRDVHWPDAHHAVLRRFVELARRGTDVVYVPGNHDAAFRDLCGVHLAGIEVCREIVHACADARRYVERFERAAAHEALRRGLDGVICGHIHRPGIREVDGILYCNDGDWVEHCTALVEDRAGRLTLVAAGASQPQLAPVLPAFGHAA